MRLVFDCRSVFEGMGGIGRATAALARELPAAMPGHEVILLFGARRPEKPLVQAPNVRELPVDAAMIDPEFDQIRLPGLLDELEADVYHGTCFSVPLARGGAKRVATVHDVVFRRRPDLVEPKLRSHLDRWTGVSCELAEAVVTVSEFSRREIAELYGRPAERIDVVPNAVDESFFQILRAGAQNPPFILYVGAIEAKKNIAALIRGFGALVRIRPDLPHILALVGSRGPSPLDLDAVLAREPEAAPRVRLLGHVSEERLRELYGAADLFCYLSEYEGFGLPPLEAMAAGVPTIVANRTSLPEATGDGAVVVDPHDSEAVASAMIRTLADLELRRQLVGSGRAAARRFSWSASARLVTALYERTLAAVNDARSAAA